MSLRKFEDLTEAIAINPENPYELTARTIAALSEIPYDEVRTWPVSVLQSPELSEALAFVNSEPKKRLPSEKLELNGKKYTVNLYPQKWTAGQWLDYTNIAKEESDVKKMARLIACFTIPKGCEYGKGYDFDELVNELNENMDIETAMGFAGFFQLQFDAFTKALLAYSERQMKKLKKSTRRLERRSNKDRKTVTQDTQRNGQAS